MIAAYFLIAAFIFGWLSGADYATEGKKWTHVERTATAVLCLVWPFLVFVLFKMWREGKL